ncbi:hypothetical protein BDV06DRAFT_211704 [Aspergillus oleicola]
MNTDGGEGSLVDQFVKTYRQGLHHSQPRAENVAERCGHALRQAGVLHNIRPVAIDSKRLESELKMRELIRGSQYRNEEDIEADIMDLARVSVELNLPSEKECVSKIIRNHFETHWPGGIAKNTIRRVESTDPDTEYYWVSLVEEKQMWPPRIVEIKVSTDPGDRLFRNQHELGMFLCEWAATKGRHGDCGDVRPLWELMELLHLRRVDVFRDILVGLDNSSEANSESSRKASEFKGLEFSLAMCVTNWIMRLPRATKRIEDKVNFIKRGPEDQKQRYKVEVIRNSFIWLAYLYSWGAGAGQMLLGDLNKAEQDIQQKRIFWLDKRCTKSFFDGRTTHLSAEESHDLHQLWLLFKRHQRLPAQYVFNLARLGVKGSSPPCWPDFRRAIFDLVYV